MQTRQLWCTLIAALVAATSYTTLAQQTAPEPMSFFITSVGKGDGANLGGLAGADAHCQSLAAAAGRGDSTWRAYLSTQGSNAVNARDRIGSGPWYAHGGRRRIAQDLGELHGDTLEQARRGNAMGKMISLTEEGEPVPGVGDEEQALAPMVVERLDLGERLGDLVDEELVHRGEADAHRSV